MKKRAYICDTPFQVFNALNFAYHMNGEEADLYIVKQFTLASKLYQNLKKDNLFKNVYLVERDVRKDESNYVWYLKRIYYYLFPNRTIKRNMGKQYSEIKGKKYEYIMISTVSCFAACMCNKSKGACIELLEDGTGSYSNDIVKDTTGQLHKLFSKVTGKGSGSIYPECLYVNNVLACKSKAAKIIKKLPDIDEGFLSYACEIYEYSSKKMEEKHNIVWLTQPDERAISSAEMTSQIKDMLLNYKKEVRVWMHPREMEPEKYRPLKILDNRTMWELEISFNNINEWILISNFSTAQITPKLIYNKEPYVIFLYPLYRTIFTEEKYASIDENAHNIKEMYSNKNKVWIVQNIEELLDVLEKIDGFTD